MRHMQRLRTGCLSCLTTCIERAIVPAALVAVIACESPPVHGGESCCDANRACCDGGNAAAPPEDSSESCVPLAAGWEWHAGARFSATSDVRLDSLVVREGTAVAAFGLVGLGLPDGTVFQVEDSGQEEANLGVMVRIEKSVWD